MQAPRTTIWEMHELTPIKHGLLRNYLEWWFPTMLQKHERIRFIDGFAGPGEYKGHEPGSPIIAIDALHRSISNREQINRTSFWFIDEHERRCAHLYKQIDTQKQNHPLLVDLQTRTTRGCFTRILHNYLSIEEQKQIAFAPTFTFIDPFGVSDTPLSIITRLMRYPHNEVLITFMHEGANRCLTHDEELTQRHLREMFGTEPCQYIDLKGDRIQQICTLYTRQLRNISDITYVTMLQLQSKSQGAGYSLVFGTHSRESIEKMKELFWELDPRNGSIFLAPDPNQPYLFASEPDYTSLVRELTSAFKGQTIGMCELEEYVLAETRFRKKHIEKVLLLLQQVGQISMYPDNDGKIIKWAEKDLINFFLKRR